MKKQITVILFTADIKPGAYQLRTRNTIGSVLLIRSRNMAGQRSYKF